MSAPREHTPHLPYLKYGIHDRITLKGIHYCLPEGDENGYLLRRSENTKLCERFNHSLIDALRKRPDYEHSPDYYCPDRARARNSTGANGLDDLATRELPKTLWKWEIATRVLRLLEAGKVERTEEGMQEALTLAHEAVSKLDVGKVAVKPTVMKRRRAKVPGKRGPYGGTQIVQVTRRAPKLRTVRNWLALLTKHGHHPWVLRDGRFRSGRKEPRLTGEARRLLIEYGDKYADPLKPSIRRLHADLTLVVTAYNKGKPKRDRIVCPSRNALTKYIGSLGAFYVYSKRHDEEKAKRRFAVVTQGPDVVRPYQRLEMDSWEVDLHGILTGLGMWDQLDEKVRRAVGRMQLCVIEDAATRCIVGATLSETADTAAAMTTLRMAVSDKKPFADAVGAVTPWDMVSGLNLIVTDAGTQFNNAVMRQAISWLGGSHDIPPGGNPGLRGRIERLFLTVHTLVISRFHGRSFSNVVAKGDYPATALANMETHEVAYVLVRWMVDAYHNRPHDGLAGETPRNAWIRLTKLFGVKPPPDRNLLRHVFGIPLTCTLGNRGLRVLSLHYWCEALADHFLDHGFVDMEVKADPEDLGRISVRIGEAWHIATCLRPGFDDVSMETWIRAVRDLRRIHADDATITEDVMFEAIQAIEGIGKAAQARAGIAAVRLTAEDIARAEREVMLGFKLPDQRHHGDEDPDVDLLSGGIITGTTRGDAGASTPPAPTTDDIGFEE